MCGIAGVYSLQRPIEPAWLEKMQQQLCHRGPDGTGIDLLPDQGVGLAHTRLAVIDLTAAGRQPMWNEDKTIGIIFNGEIYNFLELRGQLKRWGKRFHSRTDTEVILKGYEMWGIDVIGDLNGMFALAIWDGRERALYLVRDRLGKKPLYWWEDPSKPYFAFASEIKALLELPFVSRQIDANGLQCYLSLGYIPAPFTIFRNIHKLPAAHYLRYDGSTVKIHRYWDVTSLGDWKAPREEYCVAIRTAVEQAVQRRLISDVPLGAFLSGGVDSSIVVGLMSNLLKEPVRTFSAAFDVGARSFKYNVDADTAEVVSQAFGTEHTRLLVTPEAALLNSLRHAVWHMDEPHANPTIVTTYLLARLVKERGVTVILSGDGGDELFAGYRRYLYDRYVSWFRRVPAVLRAVALPVATMLGKKELVSKAIAKSNLPPQSAVRYLSWREQFNPIERTAMLQPEWSEGLWTPEQSIEQALTRLSTTDDQELFSYADLSLWIAEESNMRVDKMSMAHALEVRAPFLDYKVAELALAIPFRHKVGLKESKKLLKAAFADFLPEIVIERPKWGWFSPVYYWVKDLLWEEASRLIRWLPETGIFTPKVNSLLDAYPTPTPLKIWMLTVFALWYHRFMK